MASNRSVGRNAAPVIVRPSRDDDVDAMLAIYRHHIAAASSLLAPMIRRLCSRTTSSGGGKNLRKHRLPHLVADRGGVVVGYAYAVLFRKRPAYRYTRQALDLCPSRPSACAASAASCCRH